MLIYVSRTYPGIIMIITIVCFFLLLFKFFKGSSQKIFKILEETDIKNGVSKYFRVFMLFIIFIYSFMVLFIIYIPFNTDEYGTSKYLLRSIFYISDRIVCVILTVEYIARIFTANIKYKSYNTVTCILKYVFSLNGIIDFLVIFLPIIIGTRLSLTLSDNLIFMVLQVLTGEIILLKLLRYKDFLHKHKVMIFIYLYIFIWLFFGLQYWFIANESRGKDFIIQGDIYKRIEISAFRLKIDNNTIPDESIEKILNDNIYKKLSSPFFTDNLGRILIYPDTIGKNWANFYQDLYASHNITYFKLKFPKDGKTSIFSDQMINMLPSKVQSKSYIYPIIIEFYGPTNISKPKNIDSQNIIRIESDTKLNMLIYLMDETPPNNLVLKDSTCILINNSKMINELKEKVSKKYEPINFTDLVQNSIVFLDNSIKTLNDVKNHIYSFPIIDFLYFSAVTITTVGYGDILPNSTVVRILVMIETFLGLIFMGIAISLIFEKINSSKEKNRVHIILHRTKNPNRNYNNRLLYKKRSQRMVKILHKKI